MGITQSAQALQAPEWQTIHEKKKKKIPAISGGIQTHNLQDHAAPQFNWVMLYNQH